MFEPRWRCYLRFWKRNVVADVDDELRFHFEERLAELQGQGLSRGDAMRRAREEFGDPFVVRGVLVAIDRRIARRRDMRDWLDALRLDVAAGVKSLARQPAFSLAVIVTLTLGLGVNAAMFSFLDRVFLRMPTGLADPSQLRRLWAIESDKKQKTRIYELRLSADDREVLATALGADADFALFSVQGATRFGDDGERDKRVIRADANYLRVLGVRTQRGRLFTSDEADFNSPAPVAVISDALWRARFGADDGIIGKSLIINGIPLTIVGVASPGFRGPDLNAVDVWTPLAPEPWGSAGFMRLGSRPSAGILIRKNSSVGDEVIGQRVAAALRRARALHPDNTDSLHGIVAGSIIQARGPGNEQAEIVIAERLGVVGIIVLLIACANVMNLLLAHAIARRREIAVRVALGVSRARLIWLLVAPNVVLSTIAGVVAASSAWVTGSVLRTQLTPDIQFTDAPMHWRVLAFTLFVSLICGMLASLVPALQVSRPDITTFLKVAPQTGAVQRSKLRTGLLVAQAALSVILLVGAGLFLRSLWKVESIRIGYDAQQILAAAPDLMQGPDSVRMNLAAERVRQIRGVIAVGMSTMAPMGGGVLSGPFFIANDSVSPRSGEAPSFMNVTRNYFAITGMSIVRGTAFAPEPTRSIVVNETLARQFWPNGEPLGQCVRFKADGPCFIVAGIAEDAHRYGVLEKPHAHYFVPLSQTPYARGMGGYNLIIRAEPNRVADVGAAIQKILIEQFPGVRPNVRRMTDMIAPGYRPFRLGARLFTAFGLLAFVVAMVGVYSAISYIVQQRTHEFGVRIALGAAARDVYRHVVPRALAPVAVGAAIGIGVALATGRLIAALLYEVSATDALVMSSAVVLLLVTAATAALIPARRASRVDPVIALRAD